MEEGHMENREFEWHTVVWCSTEHSPSVEGQTEIVFDIVDIAKRMQGWDMAEGHIKITIFKSVN